MIGISGKDRGAILPAGHKGTAYMYMAETGRFASSTYYMAQHPAWVNAFNAGKPADAFKKTWAPLLPEAAYARSVPDGQTWQVATATATGCRPSWATRWTHRARASTATCWPAPLATS